MEAPTASAGADEAAGDRRARRARLGARKPLPIRSRLATLRPAEKRSAGFQRFRRDVCTEAARGHGAGSGAAGRAQTRSRVAAPRAEGEL